MLDKPYNHLQALITLRSPPSSLFVYSELSNRGLPLRTVVVSKGDTLESTRYFYAPFVPGKQAQSEPMLTAGA